MMSRANFYLGYSKGQCALFKAVSEPTAETHGDQYAAVVGPFRTKRGALFMQAHGRANPHCRTVAEAETLARTAA